MISAGALRRFAHPILLRYWLKRCAENTTETNVGDFRLKIRPTVFHPKYFGSSAILGEFVQSLELSGRRFLDMGTGSGIIGLIAARAGASVTSVDINPQSIECARENANAAGLWIDFRESDLFSALKSERYDVIAWNPPFFPRPATNLAEAALHAGTDYSVIQRFAREARNYLTESGVIFLILSMDLNVSLLQTIFARQGFSAESVLSRKWGLGETMVVFRCR